MADERRVNGRRYGRRRKNHWDRGPGEATGNSEGSTETQQGASSVVDCAICHKAIYDLSSALADKDTGDPIHFDCALRRVAEREDLAPGEKLVYIGAGAFAVVEYKDKSETNFTVKRRLPFEEEGKKQEWRKVFSARLGNI